MQLKLLLSMLAIALCTTSVLAAPQVRYQITPIGAPPESQLTALGLNNRGEVVGSWSGIGQHGFYWRDGRLVDLNDQVYPNAGYVEAIGINDRSQIVGIYSDATIEGFHAFVLWRGSVRDVEGPPDALHVFANLINDRGQIIGAAYDFAGNYSTFLNDHGTVEVFDPSFEPGGINNAGTVSGRHVTADGVRAALWKDGVITPIGPLFSSGGGINDRGQVIGYMSSNVAARAFVWERGRLTQLPALRADQTYSWALGINNAGRIVGETVINEPTGTVQIATVWDNGQVADLNALIHPADPLRAFVTFSSAGPINDRGEIVARGMDSRFGTLDTYFLEPARH